MQEVVRRQSPPRTYTPPKLLACRANELWSWDITKLIGPRKWTYVYLYNILDIFSRYVVGWMIAYRESAFLAETLIASVNVTLLWNLIVHGASTIDWETSFRFAILFGIILPWIETRKSNEK